MKKKESRVMLLHTIEDVRLSAIPNNLVSSQYRTNCDPRSERKKITVSKSLMAN